MCAQINFAFSDIKRNWGSYLLKLMQIIAVLFIIVSALNQRIASNDYKQKLTALGNLNNIFVINDVTDNDICISRLTQEDSVERLSELYEFIVRHDNIISYTHYVNNIAIANPALKDLANTSISAQNNSSVDFCLFNSVFVMPNFVDFFSLEASSGRMFNENEYSQKEQLTPIVMGHDFSPFYNIGDVIDEEYRVVGFLEKGIFYLNPLASNDVNNLDKTIVFPLILNDKSDFSEYDMAICKTFLITEAEASLQEIAQKSNDLKLYDFEFQSFKDRLDYIIAEAKTLIDVYIFISSMIMFFCATAIVSNMLHFVQSHKREFAIHLMCGAKMSDFALRVFLQLFFLFAIAMGIIAIFVHDKTNLQYLTAFSLASLALISVVPMSSVATQKINDLLRNNE